MMKWYSFLATLGPIGYLPAPGTMATLVTLPVVYNMLAVLPTTALYTLVCVIMCLLGLVVIHKTLPDIKRDDPSEIIIDEVVGCMITFIGISWSVESVLLGFILFRFFDILKIAGIDYLQSFQGEWGIMADDVVAGMLSNLILRLFF